VILRFIYQVFILDLFITQCLTEPDGCVHREMTMYVFPFVYMLVNVKEEVFQFVKCLSVSLCRTVC